MFSKSRSLKAIAAMLAAALTPLLWLESAAGDEPKTGSNKPFKPQTMAEIASHATTFQCATLRSVTVTQFSKVVPGQPFGKPVENTAIEVFFYDTSHRPEKFEGEFMQKLKSSRMQPVRHPIGRESGTAVLFRDKDGNPFAAIYFSTAGDNVISASVPRMIDDRGWQYERDKNSWALATSDAEMLQALRDTFKKHTSP